MILGIIFIIIFIAGIIMTVIGIDKEIELLFGLGMPCLFGGFIGTISFICVNIETLIKWLTI